MFGYGLGFSARVSTHPQNDYGSSRLKGSTILASWVCPVSKRQTDLILADFDESLAVKSGVLETIARKFLSATQLTQLPTAATARASN